MEPPYSSTTLDYITHTGSNSVKNVLIMLGNMENVICNLEFFIFYR